MLKLTVDEAAVQGARSGQGASAFASEEVVRVLMP